MPTPPFSTLSKKRLQEEGQFARRRLFRPLCGPYTPLSCTSAYAASSSTGKMAVKRSYRVRFQKVLNRCAGVLADAGDAGLRLAGPPGAAVMTGSMRRQAGAVTNVRICALSGASMGRTGETEKIVR